MAQSISILLLTTLLAFAPCSFCVKTTGGYLYPQFYDHSCPKAQQIVQSIVAKAVAKEARMAASLLRLHFHDCFVKGCDASLLLDSSGSIISEKMSNPNRQSARGFEVIDEIKTALENECPQTVSCADILALAARDSTVLTGGPTWEVPLGRKDSRGASLSGSNNNIPAPNNTFQTILTKFKVQGLNVVDLVALSGSHTIGNARCTSFRQRLYNQSGGDQNLFFLDFASPTKFDNSYFKNILASKGLLNSDQVLLTKNEASMELVKKYAENNELFFEQFAKSMIKMGNISPLTGPRGEDLFGPSDSSKKQMQSLFPSVGFMVGFQLQCYELRDLVSSSSTCRNDHIAVHSIIYPNTKSKTKICSSIQNEEFAIHLYTFNEIPQNPPSYSTRSLTKSSVFTRHFTSASQESNPPAPSDKVAALVDEISQLTLLEISDLTEVLRNKLDIKEMPVMAVMMPGMGFSGVKAVAKGGAGAAAKVEEKVERRCLM
ncbi:hypothetical protein GH714_015515 [Hevea brasiliensis]|uniref:peroxidase n=1 Tax=Hevea brasiliensis TaxID=3981 RepID=A0A6A6KPA7_HEVBR|nr:hypothetical protein GH714_015515 [Hevea brasiliensis]